MLRLSRHKNLHAKLTFLPTGSTTGYPCADMHAACLKIIDAFGPERCVWGSDFPSDLWTPKVSYAEHLKIFTEALPLKIQPGLRFWERLPAFVVSRAGTVSF